MSYVRLAAAILTLVLALLPATEATGAADRTIPRHVLALYDGNQPRTVVGPEAYAGNIHRLLEMPLNHLGLVVDYRNIRDGLPELTDLEDIRGILIWFDEDVSTDPEAFLAWCERMMDGGKRLVLVGNLPVNAALQSGKLSTRRVNQFWGRLGLRWQDDPAQITYRVAVKRKTPAMVEFERPLPGCLPPFEATRVVDPRATSHLTLWDETNLDSEGDVVVTGPAGGYVAENYLAYHARGGFFLQWYLNPFEFFRRAFDTDDLPKPDATTLCGLRIFYSHIDGDGWRNESEVGVYKERRTSAAEVLYHEVLCKFPDLPVTVGPIAGDLDPEWYGTRDAMALARLMFALPNVEAGSHTYSHPLTWSALSGVPMPTSAVENAASGPEEDDHLSVFGAAAEEAPSNMDWRAWTGPRVRQQARERPSSYERGPFDLQRDIQGSIDFLNRLCPEGKRVEVLQWSGNCCPFEAAVEAVRTAGIRAINGGDSRFDVDYPSYLWVAPLGRQIGALRQVYASNSNEETYTDLWTDRFFGFRDLLETVRRTESPLRVRPFNLYYHMYSAEKEASLAALVGNLEFARRQELIPLATSHYAGIADGFFTTQLTRTGPRAWRIAQRDRLQTVRFDAGVTGTVNFAESRGAIGQRRYQGSLYVALDPAVPVASIVLGDGPAGGAAPASAQSYLFESRWPVWNVQPREGGFGFLTTGFGRGDMAWKLPGSAPAVVRVAHGHRTISEQTIAPQAGLLRFSLGTSDDAAPLEVSVLRKAVLP